MTREEAIYLLRNTAWLAPSGTLEPVEEAVDMAINALEAMDNARNMVQHVGNVDLISREDAMDILDDFQKDIENGVDNYAEYRDRLLSLPGPVGNSDTLRPKGKWIVDEGQQVLMQDRIADGEDWKVCSVCGCGFMVGHKYNTDRSYHKTFHNFCPQCGAYMRGEKDE